MNPENSQAALSQLQQIQQTSQNPNDILANQRQQLGYQGAQDTVTGLRGAINNTTKLLKQVAPSVMGRTGSSLVTNAQATKQISNEQAPISQTLTEQGTQLSDADRTATDINQKAQEAASGIYTGQQDKLSYAQNLYNTLYQREQAAQAAKQAEADRQEQIRQFNESLAQERAASAAANKQFDYGVGQDANTQKAAEQQALAVNKQNAVADVRSVIGKANLLPYAKSVYESATRGNSQDKIKLEVLQSLAPQLFKGGKLNYSLPAYAKGR